MLEPINYASASASWMQGVEQMAKVKTPELSAKEKTRSYEGDGKAQRG